MRVRLLMRQLLLIQHIANFGKLLRAGTSLYTRLTRINGHDAHQFQ